MSNKTLVWLTAVPALVMSFAGLLDIYVDDGATTILGLWLLGFGAWSLIRLYKYDPLPSKAEAR